MNAYAEKSSAEKNQTGIPRGMKAGFEHSSGFSFDDVKVHYNSEKPAQLHAHAYTRGNEVYVAPGQEKHLPHELGHVVQQKRNEVKPTGEIGGLPLNDDEKMENGADKIAEKAEAGLGEAPVQAKLKDGGVVQKADDTPVSGHVYNWTAGLASTLLTGVGMIGGAIGFFNSKSKERKRLYDEEIDKYADAACDAHEEYIEAKSNVNNNNSDNLVIDGKMKMLATRVKRNYNTAIKKAIKYGALSDQGNDEDDTEILTKDKIHKIEDLNVRNALLRAKKAYDESKEALNQNGQPNGQPLALSPLSSSPSPSPSSLSLSPSPVPPRTQSAPPRTQSASLDG